VNDPKQPRTIEFLIATLPDAIDSNSRWMFDPIIDALQRAASESGFVLDRFFIPDWNRERDGDHASEPSGAHERWPGIILFREPNTAPSTLLIVFCVSETAVSGVHQDALKRSLATIRLLASPAATIRVLGPTFSGSIRSLVRVLRDFRPTDTLPRFRIVSGVATSSTIRETNCFWHNKLRSRSPTC